MSFPTQLLDGYQHAVLSLTNDQAKLLVYVGNHGIEGLARDMARRCPSAGLSRITSTHYMIDHSAFSGELTKCGLVPGTALLEVRAPDLELRKVLGGLPGTIGRYVVSETGSIWCGMLAGLGTLAVVTQFGPLLTRARSDGKRRGWRG